MSYQVFSRRDILVDQFFTELNSDSSFDVIVFQSGSVMPCGSMVNLPLHPPFLESSGTNRSISDERRIAFAEPLILFESISPFSLRGLIVNKTEITLPRIVAPEQCFVKCHEQDEKQYRYIPSNIIIKTTKVDIIYVR